jgi:hypothetical protein
MSEIDLVNDSKPEGDAAGATSKRKSGKKAKPAKKVRAKKPAGRKRSAPTRRRK